MSTVAHRGARIIFAGGSAHLAPAVRIPAGFEPPVASIVSPGTELRRMAATAAGPDRPAGYMALTRRPGGPGFLLAAAPHGAPVSPDDPTALAVDGDIQAEHVAIARFQLMAALGLASFHHLIREMPRVIVRGSGPVATGCVLELRRIGASRIAMVTRHPSPVSAAIPGVEITRTPPEAGHVVIDCTGRLPEAMSAIAPGGFLGVLGTPDDEETLRAADLHRAGITVVGMHELAGHDPAAYQETFSKVLRWVTVSVSAVTARSWCRTTPGEYAPILYRDLAQRNRPREPFLILSWSTS